LYVQHNMKHGHGPGWKPETIYDFANYITKNGEKPQTITLRNIDANNTLNYSYTADIKSSKLYYTTNFADWGDKNYHWIELKATVTENEINATLPKNAVAYFLNITNKKGIAYSNAMTLIKK
jgi:hypothetical protein